MGMSDTGSSFSHWTGLYDHPCPDPRAGFAADGTNVAATDPTKAAAAQQHPGVEGPRVGKPAAARRRSRASRRAPVTLLNTDTANFRAMVQQFTGVPAPPAGAPVISFAGDYGFPPPPGAGGMSSYDHVRRSQQQQHPPAPLHDQLRRQQQYTGAAFGHNGFVQAGTGGGDDVFASAEDRMLLQSMQAAQTMPPGSAANNSTSLGFFA